MNRLLKAVLNRMFLTAVSLRRQLGGTLERETQVLLSLKYKEQLANNLPTLSFREVGFRQYSGTDEDGILLYIFSLLGTTHETIVDIGAGNGVRGSNAANLIINHGWTGLLIDADRTAIAAGRSFYRSCPDTRDYPPVLVAKQVTAENVDSIIDNSGFAGEIDSLLIDLDGIDYWVWKAINCVSPRVVVVEYQAIWGPEVSVSIPYRPDFQAGYHGYFGVYSGASLAAFVKLGREKGYRLVGCNRYGYNAFFIRSGIGEDIFPEIPATECFGHPFTRFAKEELLPKVVDREWVEI